MKDACDRLFRAALVFCVFLFTAQVSVAGVSYVYDDLGRVTQATYTDGVVIQYQYDANGNILAINRLQSSSLTIASFSPMVGQVGSVVTISGSGFSATPGSNAVTVGGAAAPVSSASPTQLVITVPSAAQTGVITVTVGSNTATSAQQMIVRRPVIASVSPLIVNTGAAVTVTGNNFALVPPAATITSGTIAATVTSLTNTKAVFTAPANGSGFVRLNTAYGQATSPAAIYVLPPALPAANVVATGAVAVGGASATLNIGQINKIAVLAFDATVDQMLSVQVSSYSLTPSNGIMQYSVYAPTGAVVSIGAVSTGNPSIHLPRVTQAGRYLAVFQPGGSFGATGSVTAYVEEAGTMAINNAPQSVSTAVPGQSRRYTFPVQPGQNLTLALSSVVMNPNLNNAARAHVFNPSGGEIAWFRAYTNQNGASYSLPNNSAAGTYSVIVYPENGGTATFLMNVSTAVVDTLGVGSSYNLNLDLPGRFALVSFTTTSVQTLAFNIDSMTITPYRTMRFSIYNAAGTEITAGFAGYGAGPGWTANLRDLAAGTYTARVYIEQAATGTMTLKLLNGMTGVLPVDGTDSAFSSALPSMAGYFTFNAAAGGNYSVAVTDVNTPPNNNVWAYLIAPNGAQIDSMRVYNNSLVGAFRVIRNAIAGTYTVRIETDGYSTPAYKVTVSPVLTGTLTPGTPVNMTLAARGQIARYSIVGAAGQSFVLGFTSVLTNPWRAMRWTVLNPSNGQVTNGFASSGGSGLSTFTTPSAGTYIVEIYIEDAATGSAQVTLANPLGGTLASDNSTSTTLSTSVVGQNATFTIPAVAGQNLAIALRHLVLNPNSGNITLELHQPNGTYIWGRACYVGDPVGSCGIQFTNLPVTGDYQLVAYPSQWTTMSFDLTVSLALSGTFTPGTPVNLVSTVPGQFSYYSFNATAGGTYALNFSNVSTNPAGVNLYLSITRPDGSSFSQTFNSNTVVNLPNLAAGTWKVFLVPYYGVAGGATITLTQAITTALTVNGPPTHIATTVPAEPAAFMFEGVAGGPSLQLASTNMVTSPTSVSGVSFNIYAPNGSWVAGLTGNRTSNPGDSVVFNVTQTGTYKIYAQPNGTGTASFDLTLSSPIMGTIVKGGGPLFVNMALPAQYGRLNFNATSGQNLTINFTSVTTVPANVHLWIDVVNPGGSIIASAHGTAATRQINLGGLAAGSYTIYIWPTQAVTTSMNIEIP